MLFKDHSDLLEEFEYFLPDNTTGGPQVTMQQTLNNQAKGKLGGRMGVRSHRRAHPSSRRHRAPTRVSPSPRRGR
jgi:histone deacetylase complex regulatory component SIN3